MSSLLHLMSNRNYGVYNKSLALKIGLVEAVMFGELCSEYDYFNQRNELKEGWFFSTITNIEEQLGISRKVQDRVVDNLVSIGLIETKLMSIPAKRYFKINEEKLVDILDLYDFPSLSKNDNQECTNGTTQFVQKGQSSLSERDNLININKERVINKSKKEESISKDILEEKEKVVTRNVFKRPSIEEVQAYIDEKGYTSFTAQEWHDHYTSNGWMVGKTPMKDWKGAVRTWNNNRNKYKSRQDNTQSDRNKNYTNPNLKKLEEKEIPF